jgi:crotonobetainyl-CoA:carnitine CoA-transferase CaiB-like acyl-CoA transferase
MKAFEGVRIVEFAQVIAGPYACALLAGLGADVIKVEPPAGGDQARRLMDSGPLASANMAPLYQGLNAGKRSITLDLKHPDSREVVRRLVAGADAVVENSRPGVMARLGLGYEDLRAIRGDIVYCSVSGFGQTGPRSAAPAYDGAIQAASGMMSVNGREGEGPTKVGFAVSDVAAALMTAFALSSALYRRAQTGEGQYLDVSMLDTSLWMLSPLISNFAIGGEMPRQLGNMSLTRLPTADVFPTRDGNLQVSAITQAQVRLLWEALGRADLAADPRYSSQELQVRNAAALRGLLVECLAERTAAEWEQALNAAGVPASRVLSIPDALVDAQVMHRDPFLRYPAREGLPPAVVMNAGFQAVPDGPGTKLPPPLLGEHTGEVLAELGFSATEIAEMRDAGAI